MSLTLKVQAESTTDVNASTKYSNQTKTVGMLKTGLPFVLLLLTILTTISVILVPKK